MAPPKRPPKGPGAGHWLAALSILASLSLGLATLSLGLTQPEAPPAPSVSVEETDPAQSQETPTVPNGPGFDPRQAALVDAEDKRIFAAVGQLQPGTPMREIPFGTQLPTLVLPARIAPYDLDTLVNAGAAARLPDGALLQKNVIVGPGAQLHISLPKGNLRMASGSQGFTSLVAFKGSLNLEGAPGSPLSISSWDTAKNAADSEVSDGRAYVREIGGRMDLRAVNTFSLGFWSGSTGGVAWTGSASEVATGSAREVNLTGNHYGIFTRRSRGLLINGAQVTNSAMDGVAVNRDAEGAELWRVTSAQNARNGIALAKGANNISLREVTSTGNARNGIFIDGSPPAAGPNAGGATTAHFAGFNVDASMVRGNAEHGVLVSGANKVVLSGNTVAANRDGVIVRGVTEGLVIRENKISSPGGFAVAIRDGSKDALVDKNIITDALTAVQLNNSVAKVSGNEISGMTMHAVSLIGAAGGSSVVDNRLAGRGPSDIDTTRVAAGNLVPQSGNDKRNWVEDKDNLQYIGSRIRSNPLILLWALILLIPMAGRIYWKHRQTKQGIGQHPYRNSAPPSAVAAAAAAAPKVLPGAKPGRAPRPAQPVRARGNASAIPQGLRGQLGNRGRPPRPAAAKGVNGAAAPIPGRTGKPSRNGPPPGNPAPPPVKQPVYGMKPAAPGTRPAGAVAKPAAPARPTPPRPALPSAPSKPVGAPSKPAGGPSKPTGAPSKPAGGPSKPAGGPAQPASAKPANGPVQPAAIPPAKPTGPPAKPTGPAKPAGAKPAGLPMPKPQPTGADRSPPSPDPRSSPGPRQGGPRPKSPPPPGDGGNRNTAVS